MDLYYPYVLGAFSIGSVPAGSWWLDAKRRKPGNYNCFHIIPVTAQAIAAMGKPEVWLNWHVIGQGVGQVLSPNGKLVVPAFRFPQETTMGALELVGKIVVGLFQARELSGK